MENEKTKRPNAEKNSLKVHKTHVCKTKTRKEKAIVLILIKIQEK